MREMTAGPFFRPVLGVVLMAIILLAAPVYGRATSGGKIDPEISRESPTVNIVVDLTVDVSTFHREELSKFGVFSGRDRENISDRSRVRLQNVTQRDLTRLTYFFWVDLIERA